MDSIDRGSRSSSPSCRNAIRSDSPVFTIGSGTPPGSPSNRRARELKRELKQARTFRASLERSRDNSRSSSRCGTPGPSQDSPLPVNRSFSSGQEMSFTIRPSLGGRKGWKIMPEAGGESIEDPELLQRVVDMIRDMECSGISVPETITLKV